MQIIFFLEHFAALHQGMRELLIKPAQKSTLIASLFTILNGQSQQQKLKASKESPTQPSSPLPLKKSPPLLPREISPLEAAACLSADLPSAH